MEPYCEIKSQYEFSSFYFITYMNDKEYIDSKNIKDNCKFYFYDIKDSYNYISFIIDNNCNSSAFNYTIIIETGKYYKYSPLYKILDKNKNINNNSKIYEFQQIGKGTFEKTDSFEKGDMLISIVGQDTKGFNQIVYNSKEYNYKGEKKSYLVVIIIGSIILTVIIIFCVLRHIKKKKKSKEPEYEKMQILPNKKDEDSADFKNYKESADFKKYENINDFKMYEGSADFKKYKDSSDFKKYENSADFKKE